MKVLILYFSGTGNTAYVGEYLANNLQQQGVEVRIASIESIDKSEIVEYNHLVFGFPVFGGDAPSLVQSFIVDLPLTVNKSVFLYCTKAISSGSALFRTQRIFEKNGFLVMGFADISMPGSDGLAFLNKDSAVVQKINRQDFSNIPKANLLAKKLMTVKTALESGEEIEKYKDTFKISALEKTFGLILIKILPFFENRMKNKFWADDKCIKCKKCEKICPTHNIKVNDLVEFDGLCCLCMRCLHQCPVEAIQIGKMTSGKFRWKGPEGLFNPLKTFTGK